jgi:hypothetical protein
MDNAIPRVPTRTQTPVGTQHSLWLTEYEVECLKKLVVLGKEKVTLMPHSPLADSLRAMGLVVHNLLNPQENYLTVQDMAVIRPVTSNYSTTVTQSCETITRSRRSWAITALDTCVYDSLVGLEKTVGEDDVTGGIYA